MQFDSFEKLDVSITETDMAKRLSALHKGFDSKLTATVSNYFSVSETAQDGVAAWIGENAALNVEAMPEAMDIIKKKELLTIFSIQQLLTQKQIKGILESRNGAVCIGKAR